MLRVCYIVNGRRYDQEVVKGLRRQIGLGQVHITEYKRHATELARRAALEGYDIVVARGGDATASEVINGLAPDFHLTLGIDPDGSGMDFPKSLGYDVGRFTGSPEVFRNALRAGQTRLIDLIRVTSPDWTLFGGSLFSGGYTAEVAKSVAQQMLRGRGMYVKTGARLAWSAQAFRIEGTYSGKVLDLCITNGEWVAGGVRIAPGASMSDGKLELLIIGDLSPALRHLLFGFARLGLIRNPAICRLFGVTASQIQDEVTFKIPGSVRGQIDGEPLDEPLTEVVVGVEPRRLRVLLPAR
jgi:diacylglycerol kinase family enzyme